MKKRNIAIFLIISILVILGIVKKIQNIYEFPYLYVISDDKKWKAYAYPAYEGGQWTGEMFFLGNKEGDVGKILLSVVHVRFWINYDIATHCQTNFQHPCIMH